MRSLFARSRAPFVHRALFENVLGTSLEIQLVSRNQADGARAERAILDEIDRLDAIFNAHNPQSELAHWASSFEQEVVISSELAQVLASAEAWRKQSVGAFNPATEALTRVWKGFEAQGAISPHELELLAEKMNVPLWEMDEENGLARRLTTLPVTLNSIAKGFIIDRAAQIGLSVDGVEQVMINIGGDIRHMGTKEVTIAVADPRAPAENANPLARIAVRNQGVATSGNYRRGFQIGERWFSHLLDPRSGWPVEKLIGVSVVAPDALSADVLAAVFSVLEVDEGLKMADALEGVGVLMVDEFGFSHSNQFWKQQLQSTAKP